MSHQDPAAFRRTNMSLFLQSFILRFTKIHRTTPTHVVFASQVSIFSKKLVGSPAGLGLRRNDIVVFSPPEACR